MFLINLCQNLGNVFTNPDVTTRVTGNVEESSSFGGIIKTVTEIGNGVVGTLGVVGMFVLVILVMIAGLLFAGSSRAEGKTKILFIIGGTIIFFAAAVIVGFSANVGSGLKNQENINSPTSNTSTATPGTGTQ